MSETSTDAVTEIAEILSKHRDCSIYDEGIWADGEVALLRCSCGWTKNIPIDDDIRHVFPIWERHLAESAADVVFSAALTGFGDGIEWARR